jgi:hypothetical protein
MVLREIKTEMKKLCNNKPQNPYSSFSIVRMIKQGQDEHGKCKGNKKYIQNLTKLKNMMTGSNNGLE